MATSRKSSPPAKPIAAAPASSRPSAPAAIATPAAELNEPTPKADAHDVQAALTPDPQHTLADPVIEPVEVIDSFAEQVGSVGEIVRLSGELGVEQARASMERVTQAAGEAAGSLSAAVLAANSGATELNLKVIDVAMANADAALDLVRALAGAKSLSEVVELQTEHARKQFEALNAQAAEIAELARKVSNTALAPLGQTMQKTFGQAA